MPLLPQPETLNLVVSLLREFMGLAADQAVVYNQKWKVPTDNRIYLTVSYVSPGKVYLNTSEQRDGFSTNAAGEQVPALIETSHVGTSSIIGLDVYSRSEEARKRKDEAVAAFGSFYAQQLSEKYSLRPGKIPATFADLSRIDGVARLSRYHVAISMMRVTESSRVIEFFADFPKPILAINP